MKDYTNEDFCYLFRNFQVSVVLNRKYFQPEIDKFPGFFLPRQVVSENYQKILMELGMFDDPIDKFHDSHNWRANNIENEGYLPTFAAHLFGYYI